MGIKGKIVKRVIRKAAKFVDMDAPSIFGEGLSKRQYEERLTNEIRNAKPATPFKKVLSKGKTLMTSDGFMPVKKTTQKTLSDFPGTWEPGRLGKTLSPQVIKLYNDTRRKGIEKMRAVGIVSEKFGISKKELIKKFKEIAKIEESKLPQE